MSTSDRAAALHAARLLTDAQQAQAVIRGLLLVTQVSPEAQTLATNHTTIVAQAVQATTDNATFIATPTGDLTNALVIAQVKALSRQNNKIIRLLLKQLDGTD